MPDWRFVTQVDAPGTFVGHTSNGLWVDLDGVDTIMVIPPGRINGARSRLGWMTNIGWQFIFCAEQIDPTYPGEANNNPQKEE